MTTLVLLATFIAGLVARPRLARAVRRIADWCARPPRNRKLPRTREEDRT